MYNNYNPYYNQLPQTRLNTFEQNDIIIAKIDKILQIIEK